MNRLRKLSISISFLSMVVALTALFGCSTLPASLYQTYSLKRGEAGFSLEYPSYYRLVGIDAYGSRDLNSPFKVQFARTKRVRGLTDNFFEIVIGGPKIDQALSVVGANNPVVLERQSTTVAGLPAETLAFSSKGFSGSQTITRAVFFEVDEGWTWVIVLRSDEGGADIAKAEFEHIIETFKVIP